MKLLREINEQIEYITESNEGGPKTFIIEGIFLQGNLKNRNGRIYPVNVLEKEVERYTENYINKKRAYGELDHPSNPSVNLTKVSHLINELKKDGNNFYGKARVLTNTTNGKIVQALMEEGCSLGVSSRGLGSLKEKSGSKVVEQYYLTTAADIVADPSGPDCFPENIVENIEWVLVDEHWTKQEKVFDLIESRKRMNKVDREARFFAEFKKLLNT